jgi:asparagine synthase (glutamine-hydrolysing)
VRAPFLDFELVDFVSSLPYSYKCRNLRTKFILKQLMKDKLPRGIVFRSKKGFGIPLAGWLRGELKELCNEVLSEKNINRAGIFDYNYIKQLKEEHFSSKRNNHKQLWTLMVWQMWYNRWFKN